MVPKQSRFVAYYRVSTKKQGASGLGLEAQQASVKDYVKRLSGTTLATFTEVESGRKNARPQLEAAILRCKQSNATLLVAKLDRLSRNAAFLMNLRDSGVKFEALDIPGANTMTVGVLALVAQHEAEAIADRTRKALAARRARGHRLGTPRDLSSYAKAAAVKAGQAHRAKARERAAVVQPAIEAAQGEGCTSLRQIADYLNQRSINTPRGNGIWTAATVKNALRTIGELT